MCAASIFHRYGRLWHVGLTRGARETGAALVTHYNSHLLQGTRNFLFRWYAPLWRQFVDHLGQHLAKTGY